MRVAQDLVCHLTMYQKDDVKIRLTDAAEDCSWHTANAVQASGKWAALDWSYAFETSSRCWHNYRSLCSAFPCLRELDGLMSKKVAMTLGSAHMTVNNTQAWQDCTQSKLALVSSLHWSRSWTSADEFYGHEVT